MENRTPDWQTRPILRTSYLMVKKLEPLIASADPRGDRVFFEHEQFPWIERMEHNWVVIRSELNRILEHREELPNFQDVSQDQLSITHDDCWKTFFLYGYGYRMPHNCQQCPETTRLVESIPGMLTAFFSILAPGKRIPPHRGPYNGVLRYHLGLLVPEPKEACRIRVGDEIRYWDEGKSLLFDDTFEHEVWNDTRGMRVILFVDVIRELPYPMKLVNQFVIKLIRWSPFVQSARKNVDKFQLNFEQAMELNR